jgi:general secretion pathway protein G
MRIRRREGANGFTLIEMVVVMSLILVLLSIALPMYNTAILHAKEATLKQDLYTLRHVIQQYTLDKQKAPQALEDLISAHYLKFIPKDPITGREDTWQVEQEDSILSPDQTQPGIIDVHSGSNLTASDGSAYSTW